MKTKSCNLKWCMAIVFVTLLGGCNEGLQENVVSEENACYYMGYVDCSYNEIYSQDSDLRVDEFWEKVINRSGLAIVSIMNRRFFE